MYAIDGWAQSDVLYSTVEQQVGGYAQNSLLPCFGIVTANLGYKQP